MAITLRLTKGSELTFAEMDDNFEGLDSRLSEIESSNALIPGLIHGVTLLVDSSYIQARTVNNFDSASIKQFVLDFALDSIDYSSYITKSYIDGLNVDADTLDGQDGTYYLDYTNATNTPSLATVATSGAYSDLSGTPSLATVATSGAYSDLSGTPSLATVATSGSYNDLTATPNVLDSADVASIAGANLGVVPLTVYTVATLPAGGSEGQLIYVQDGDAGSPCLAVLDAFGVYKVVSTLGAAVLDSAGGGGF